MQRTCRKFNDFGIRVTRRKDKDLFLSVCKNYRRADMNTIFFRVFSNLVIPWDLAQPAR